MKRITDFGEVHRTRRERPEDMFTIDQVVDVCRLIANEKYPNGEYSDNECCLWSAIMREFHIDF